MKLNLMKLQDNLFEPVNDYYYETETSQTITVWEDPPIRYSSVLQSNGEPYLFTREIKMGFDLRPKKENYDK